MSEFSGVLTGRVTLKRLTSNLVDSVATGLTVTLSRQPPSSCRLEVEIAGATAFNGALVNIAGSTTESFSFTENGMMLGAKNFTSITGITTSGISGGNISIKAVTPMGAALVQERQISASLPVRFYPVDGRIRMLAQGQQKIAKYKMMAEGTAPIKENDLVYVLSGFAGLTLGQVSFVDQISGFDGATHHIECEIVQP